MPTSRQRKMTVSLYTPHSGQLLLHNNLSRFRVLCCGRRFGKTLACTNEIAKKALEKPNSLNWWVAPTYRQTEIAFNLVAEALRPVLTKEPNRSKMRLDLINGSIIECRSAERYENLRGDGPSFVVMDEAAKCPKAAWTEAIRPALADNQGGAIFISTPWGRDWFWELFMLGQNPDESEWWSASFPTSANPFIPAKEIEAARRDLPKAVFEQEFLAVFLEDGASVFRNVAGCVDGDFEEPLYGHAYIIGWDVAKYTDYSVMSVIDAHTGHLVHFERFNGIEYQTQIDNVLVPLAKKYNDAHVIMDCTGVGDPVLEEVRKREVSVEGYYFTNATKKQLIDGAVVAVERRYITYPNIAVLLNEMRAFSYEITKSNNVVYKAPEGQHDDCVMSLCLAIYGAKRGATVPFAMTSSEPASLAPEVKAMDSAFLMARQEQMARTLARLHTTAPYQAPEPIRPDDGWGIA